MPLASCSLITLVCSADDQAITAQKKHSFLGSHHLLSKGPDLSDVNALLTFILLQSIQKKLLTKMGGGPRVKQRGLFTLLPIMVIF
jgi:hypothetical protein